MLTRHKILAIGSDPALMNLLEQNFNEGAYEIVSTPQTGIHLRDVLHIEDPDFIILDIMMPNLDGIGICLQLRQWTQIPIMMLSAWGTTDGMIRGLNLGSDSYLTEPFGIDKLKTQIKDTINKNTAMITNPLNNTHTGTV